MWHRCLYKSKPCTTTTTTTAPPPLPPPERERERERCQRWRPSSSITLIFHNNMKNSVHRRGLMNCIFRVTLAFLMKLDESPQAGQLCLNWCWLCQGTSMATPLRETQTFHRLINLPFALSDNFSKNMWSKVWHLSQSDPETLHPPTAPPLFFIVLFVLSGVNTFVVGGINAEEILWHSSAVGTSQAWWDLTATYRVPWSSFKVPSN